MDRTKYLLLRGLKLLSNLGFSGLITYTIFRILETYRVGYIFVGRIGRLYSNKIKYPVIARRNSSDISVFWRIYCELEYERVLLSHEPKIIVDLGANIGLSSTYFLTKFPSAFVVAVEPDSDNYHILEHNLASYSVRSLLVHAAIWSRDARLKIVRRGPKEEWATTVRECAKGEPADIIAYSMESLFELSHIDKVDILKIDIEGSELAIFSEDCSGWLDKVSCIIIELHNEKCVEAFDRAISGRNYQSFKSGEVYVVTFQDNSKSGECFEVGND